MNSNFWVFGGLLSVGAHLAILMIFLMASCGRQQEVVSENPVTESPVQEETPPAPPSEVQPVQAAAPPRAPTAAVLTSNEVPPGPPSTALQEYEVRPGDTLSAIARRVGCTVAKLAEVNKSSVKKLSRLRVGQRLILPNAFE